jgi:hypothetical protein
VRTTKAGTWFPALSTADEPAGLLLLHPAVKPGVLKAVISRLAELRLQGVLPMLPGLVDQAGRNWLVATASPTPTVADLVDDASYGTPENATALLSAIAATLLEVHAEGLAHGAVGAHAVVLGQDGEPMLADWGLDEHASVGGDVAAWGELAELLAERWCADSPADAAVLARAVNAADQPGPDGGLAGALAVLTQPDQRPDVEEPPAPAEPPPVEPRPAEPPEPPPVARSRPRPRPRPRSTGRHAATSDEPAPPVPAPPEPAPPVPAPPEPAPPEPAPPVPAPPSEPAPARVQPADLAPPSAQRYVAPPVVSPPPPAAPREARPPAPAEAPPPVAAAPPPRSASPRHVSDPLPPEAEPARSRPGPSKPGFALRQPALLTVLLTVILVTAAAVIIRPFDTKQPPHAVPAAPLEVRAVSVAAQLKQSICVLVGTVTTNGQPGRLVYRWVGESGSQAVSSVTTAGSNYQIEIGLIWSPSSPPLHGSSVTLQILEPQPSTTSTVVPIGCV